MVYRGGNAAARGDLSALLSTDVVVADSMPSFLEIYLPDYDELS